MPKKIKVVDVESSPNVEDNVKVTDSNINEIVVKVDVPETVEPVEQVAKRVRAPRVKKEVIKVDDPIMPQVEDLPEQVPEPIKVEAPRVDVVEELPKKNLKIVELVECPNCHKKLTERT